MLPSVRFLKKLPHWIPGSMVHVCYLFSYYTTTFAELYTEYRQTYMDGMGTIFKTYICSPFKNKKHTADTTNQPLYASTHGWDVQLEVPHTFGGPACSHRSILSADSGS